MRTKNGGEIITDIGPVDNTVNGQPGRVNAAVMECFVCGGAIAGNQPFRALPRDRTCQAERAYHLKTCGPGSEKWKFFKANGRKAP